MIRAGRAALFGLIFALSAIGASAQPRRATTPAGAPSASAPTNLRARLGVESAAHLLRSPLADERIRGVRRLASLGTVEAVAALASAAESNAALRNDPRAQIELARALAPFAAEDRARAALLGLVNAGMSNARAQMRLPEVHAESDALVHLELARRMAAIAVARAGSERGAEQLYAIARSGGVGTDAALVALTMAPPIEPGFFGTTAVAMTPAVARMLGQLGDLRALEVLHPATRAADIGVRSAALVALARLGDTRSLEAARAALADPDARLRVAGAEALILLSAPDRFRALAGLFAHDATEAAAIALAERAPSAETTPLLATRAAGHPKPEVRVAAIHALGRSPDPEAARALVGQGLLSNPESAYLALHALARSPAANAGELATAVARGNLRTLGVRAYLVRALARSERSGRADAVLQNMLGRSGAERALAVYGRVALGDDALAQWIDHGDATVRRAAIMGTLARPSPSTSRRLLERLRVETDGVARQLLAIGLAQGDPDAVVTTTRLRACAEGSEADAALCVVAFVARADDTHAASVAELLASGNPVIRAHAARGMARSRLPDASGRLAEAYAYETDPEVRRAIVHALAVRVQDEGAPARKFTLASAAQLDPDAPTQNAAQLGLRGVVQGAADALGHDVAWVRVIGQAGAPMTGTLVRPDGVGVPIAFDEEGFALVAGLPAGDARLLLTPMTGGR